jgi:hypothetical protein
MYANQVCSRIRRAFCKRVRLKREERQSNGVYNTLGGVCTGVFASQGFARYQPIARFTQRARAADSTNRFVSLDAPDGFLHSEASSKPALRRVRRNWFLRPALFAALQIC